MTPNKASIKNLPRNKHSWRYGLSLNSMPENYTRGNGNDHNDDHPLPDFKAHNAVFANKRIEVFSYVPNTMNITRNRD